MAMTAEQMTAVNNALNPGIQLALPQTVQPVWKSQHQVARTQYDPAKLQALMNALQAPRSKQQIAKDKWEMLGNALANNMSSPTYEGAYGVKFTNPLTDALVGSAKTFSDLYGGFKQQERDLANQDVELQNLAREDAIKAAQLDAEATKQAITDQVAKDYMKYNDPNAKTAEQQQQFNTIATLSDKLEDIGTRFDEDFKDIDDMQQKSTRLGRAVTNLAGIRVSTKEKEARDEFKAWKGSMRNILVNANRQAGSGSMSDADAERYEQNIGDAKNPAEARMILRSFMERMQMPASTKKEAEDKKPVVINGYTITEE